MAHDRPLVIFDCDGVLVDSERLAVEIDREILAEFGLELSLEDVVSRFMGATAGNLTRFIESQIGRVLTPAELGGMDARYRERFQADLVPVDGALEALAGISQPGCVASNSERDSLRWKLGLCGLLERFDGALFSRDMVVQGKPLPDLHLLAAATMGFAPTDCVVVEDSPVGLQAARAAGMRTLAYVSGMVAPERLEGAGTTLFHDMRELPGLLL